MESSSKVPVIQLQGINGKKVLATTSLTVAEFTGKRHDNVSRDIRKLIQTGEFSLLNFEESTCISDRGKTYSMFIMDELLTTVLLMGFTGDKAVRWKVAYTNEFIRMREALSKPKQETIPGFHYDMLAEQHKELQYLYKNWYRRKYGINPTDNQEAMFVIHINTVCIGEPTKTRQHLTYKGGIRIMAGYQILINQLKKGYRDLGEFENKFLEQHGTPKERYLLKPEESEIKSLVA